MSARFIVLFNGRPVRFGKWDERRVFSLVPKAEASGFVSATIARAQAARYRLRPAALIEVVPLSEAA